MTGNLLGDDNEASYEAYGRSSFADVASFQKGTDMVSNVSTIQEWSVGQLFCRIGIAASLTIYSAGILYSQSAETKEEAQFSGLSDQTSSAHVDWPQLGYNNSHTGFDPFETVLSVSTVSGLRPLWTVTTGDLSAAPAVVKGIVYVGSGDGNIYAVNAATGAIRWRTFLQGGGTSSSPAVVNGVVYLGTGVDKGYFYALDAATGKIRWKFHPAAGVPSAPVVAKGKVYFATDKVYALNASNGALVWTAITDSALSSSPAVANGKVYVGSQSGTTYALNAVTGSVVWTFANPGVFIFSSPTVANGKVYLGETDGNFYALEASSGHIAWVDLIAPGGTEVLASPAVANGVVFIGTNNSKFWALDATTGAKRWESTTAISEIFASSTAVANGVVYAAGESGILYAFDASTGKILKTLSTAGPILSSPAVINGTLYVGSFDKKLHAWGL